MAKHVGKRSWPYSARRSISRALAAWVVAACHDRFETVRRQQRVGYVSVMTLSLELSSACGLYFGTGDGVESGQFVARIAVSKLPGAGVLLNYEATSIAQGVQHQEVSMLTPGPDGRDLLHISHSESVLVTQMIESEPGSGRFVQPMPVGPYDMSVTVETSEENQLRYAWWWAVAGEPLVEQSAADTRLHRRSE